MFVYTVALVHKVDHPWMLQTIHIQCKYSGWSSLCSELSSVHFDLWTFASGQNSGFPRIQGWEEPLNGRHRQLTAGLSTPYLFYPRFPSLLRRDRQRVGHWRVENCANPGEQVAGSTRAGVPANRGVITYTLATQRTEIREPHCPISEHWRGHLSRFTQIELAGAREPLDVALCAALCTASPVYFLKSKAHLFTCSIDWTLWCRQF